MAYAAEVIRLPASGLIDLRADATARAVLSEALTIALPTTPNTVTDGDSLSILWLGPEQWLLKTTTSEEERFETLLREVTRGMHSAATIVSDHYSVFAIKGREAGDVLVQGCGIDLHPDYFAAGQCVRCKFARTQGILVALNRVALNESDALSYELYVESSYSNYLQHWFNQAIG